MQAGEMKLSVVMVSAGIEEWDLFTVPAIESMNKYAHADEFIVVDNGGLGRGQVNTATMVPYAEAVNMGAQQATGNCLLILNNDITATGHWLEPIWQQAETLRYGGPVLLQKEGTTYVEGWCVFILRYAWHHLGGFNTVFKNSWEDVDLAFRLACMGIHPTHLRLPFSHIWGATRNRHLGSDQWFEQNRRYFLDRVSEWRKE